jgi:DivIVA domain-containing protein
MNGTFRTVSRLHTGYAPEDVDEFFDHAREVYEKGTMGEVSGREVRSAAFDLVRGGYATPAVDAALDRLEAAFVARSRAQHVALNGQQAWMDLLAEQARTLYGRLSRPDGLRFAPASAGHLGYCTEDVDELCHKLVEYFDHGAPLSAQDVRAVTFRRRHGAKGYAEGPVDAFCARAIEVLLGVE